MWQGNLNKIHIVWIHVLCWAVYIGYETLFRDIFPKDWADLDSYITFYVQHIFFFYLHAHWILPLALRGRKNIYWKLPLLLALEIFLFIAWIIVVGLIMGGIEFVSDDEEAFVFDIEGIEYLLVPLLPYLLYSTGYYFIRSYIQTQRRNREIEEEHLKQTIKTKELETNLLRMEQNYLRAQVNPHLLYNTLSFVNYAAKRDPDQAERAIFLLSDVMRYALETIPDKSGMVPLEKELAQVANIIALQQMRFDNKLNVNYAVNGNPNTVRIIPLMILTVVENIFKHGYLSGDGRFANILVEIGQDTLTVTTENTIRIAVLHDSTKTGLKNLSERLAIIYPDNHVLKYGTSNDIFNLTLSVPLEHA